MECTFYVLLSFLLLSTSTLASGTPIFDSDGDAVLQGTPYDVSAYHPANGGSVGVAKLNDTCHVNLMLPFKNTQPVMLSPARLLPVDKLVLVGEFLRVVFFRPPPCEDSPMWQVDQGTRLVTTGGVEHLGSPIEFKVVQYGPTPPVPRRHLYRFLFCPVSAVPCSPVGLAEGKLLGLSTEPLVVQFTKLLQESVGSTAMHPTA